MQDPSPDSHAKGSTVITACHIFSGLKVLDLASYIAGPAATMILADFGVDVV